MADDEAARENTDLELVRQHVNQLHEHFESVQIFCTKPNPNKEGGTISLNVGAGDWFARYGKVREWVVRTEESFRVDERAAD